MSPEDVVLSTVPSIARHTIRLTHKQWVHITESHDYMAGNQEKVLETVADPDSLVTGDLGATIALRHYDATNITEKTCIAIYRDEEDGFIIRSLFKTPIGPLCGGIKYFGVKRFS